MPLEVTANSLFYNKYKYKLELITCVGHLFRSADRAAARETIDFAKQYMSSTTNWDEALEQAGKGVALRYPTRWTLRRFQPNATDIRDCEKLYNFLTVTAPETRTRVELNNLSLYSNEETKLRDLAKELSCVYQLHVPQSNDVEPNTIYHSFADKFQYKVTVGKVHDTALADYLEANNDTYVRAGVSTIRAIRNKAAQYYGTYYFYVRDDKILNIVSMFGFEIKRLDKLLPK
jgi:hypothetical protein